MNDFKKKLPKKCDAGESKCSYLLEGVNWLIDDPQEYYKKRDSRAKKVKEIETI